MSCSRSGSAAYQEFLRSINNLARLVDAGNRAWQEFYTGHAGYSRDLDWRTERVEPPAVLKPIDETSFASTNASSQYGLAAIQCLTLVGHHHLP